MCNLAPEGKQNKGLSEWPALILADTAHRTLFLAVKLTNVLFIARCAPRRPQHRQLVRRRPCILTPSG